ncbi:MAG: ATP-binding protein [Chloroflexi bacterium]|nr:ATP-binding protein [Chloroflexota bacterium]
MTSIRSHNLDFVGREKEQAHFEHLLNDDDGAPLVILNVCGHSGVGKSWLLEVFRSTCAAAQVPFAFLNPREISDDPVSLLTGFARRMKLTGDWVETGNTFDHLLAPFVTALWALDAPVVMLMLDNYDQMFQFDHYVRHLIRNLIRQAAPDGSGGKAQPERVVPKRFIVVIGSQIPLTELWTINPIRQHPLQTMCLQDFSFEETRAYLTHLDVPGHLHRAIFRLTRGYALALALVTTLFFVSKATESWPDTLDGTESGELFPPEILSPEERERLTRAVLDRGLRSLKADPQRAQIVEALYATTQARRFNRTLLAAMIEQDTISDDLFDRITRLSMVVKHRRPGSSPMFTLHGALREALLAEIQAHDLESTVMQYRHRALAFYIAQQVGMKPVELEWALDVLFLHSHPLVHSLFFETAIDPLVTSSATFDELDARLDGLMRHNPMFQGIGFTDETLEAFISQTREWLALDYALHGETLHYFRVVRRGDQRGDVVGFTLNVPMTCQTMDLLRQDTSSAIYDRCVDPIEENPRHYFSLRLVVDAWDSLAALMRTIFAQVAAWEFDRLMSVSPWPIVANLVENMGFDILAHGIEHEGITYTAVRLDVVRHGGMVNWLLNLVRQDVGLPSPDDWIDYVGQVRKVLARLWDQVSVLSDIPLITTLDLARPLDDAPTRVDRLRQVITRAHARLHVSEEEEAELAKQDKASHYKLLNELYGITGAPRRRFKTSTYRRPQYKTAELLDIPYPYPFTQLRDAAIEALAEELWQGAGDAAKIQRGIGQAGSLGTDAPAI